MTWHAEPPRPLSALLESVSRELEATRQVVNAMADTPRFAALSHAHAALVCGSVPTPAVLDEIASAFYREGNFESGLRFLRIARQTEPLCDEVLHLAHLQRWIGVFLLRIGHTHEAIDELKEALRLFGDARDPRGLSKTQNDIGTANAMLSNWSTARRAFHVGQLWAREAGESDLAQAAWLNLSICQHKQGLFVDALRRIHRVARELDGTQRANFVTNVWLVRAQIYRNLGLAHHARKVAAEALRRSRSTEFRRGEALANEFIGDALLDLGHPEPALVHFKEALRIGLEIAPEGDVVLECYRRLAEAHAARGELEHAERDAHEGLRLTHALNDDFERVALLRVSGVIAFERGRRDLAAQLFAEAVAIADRRGYRFEAALTREYQARLWSSVGHSRIGERNLERATRRYRRLGLGRLLRRLERGERALSRPRSRRAVWERMGVRASSPRMLATLDQLVEAAGDQIPTMLVGEPGVGKRLIAAAVHKLGRRGRLCVNLACETLPDLSAAGNVGDDWTLSGYFAMADGGSAILEDVTSMPRGMQRELVRFLRSRGDDDPENALRLISTATEDPRPLIERGAFDAELFELLSGRVVTVPALRDRPEEIEPLALLFLSQRLPEAADAPRLDPATVDRLVAHGWSRGNVRELRDVCSALAHVASSGGCISPEMLPWPFRGPSRVARAERPGV